jgi:hypothetical protein
MTTKCIALISDHVAGKIAPLELAQIAMDKEYEQQYGV